MNQIQLFFKSVTQHYCFWALLSGSLLPFGFAPFHCPGIAILGIALFFAQLTPGLVNAGTNARKRAFMTGFAFGVGYFSVGVSWVFVSIHDYGHLNFLMAGIITLIFILYLAFYLGLLSYLFQITAKNRSKLVCCLLFSGLWCLCEYLRATLFTGFPWLLLGFGQLDTPLKYLFPIIGCYGVGFLTALAASLLVLAFQKTSLKSIPGLMVFIGLLILPLALKNKPWTTEQNKPISVGIIQANLSMKDKWDEALFWKLLSYYENKTNKLLGKNDLIVMPESAIPAPDNYVTDFLDKMHQKGLASNTSILLGIPSQPSEAIYYNSLLALGKASGSYQKKQLVPFGEFIPKPLQKISNWLSIPIINMTAGQHVQPLILVDGHPIATLICYELAYPMLLREQLPEAEWIVSISDDGWFGKSFAIYQQLQIAQALSIQTGRYQVVANNDGLSAIIDANGNITDSLPAYQAGILNSKLYAHQGSTPWVTYGDAPILFISLFIFLICLVQRTYSMRSLRIKKPSTVSI